jgi:hypothetical protein
MVSMFDFEFESAGGDKRRSYVFHLMDTGPAIYKSRIKFKLSVLLRKVY